MVKKLFYSDEDVAFEYEEDGTRLALHCEVRRWSPSVLKKSYRVLGDFMNQKRKEGFDKMITITPNPKFAKIFGGTSVGEVDYNEMKYEVVVWDLK
jgi:hypothetical protein